MTTPVPPPPGWGDDELSKFLGLVQNNQYATFVRHKSWYGRLAVIDSHFLKIGQNILNPESPVAAALFYRAHAAFRAACGTAMAGQAVECFTLIRSCLEYGAYGLHITDNPLLTEVWLERNQTETQKRLMIREFAPARFRATIALHDQGLLRVFDDLYERTIDFGGHPNQRGVSSSLQIHEQDDRVAFLQLYLHGDGLPLVHALKTSAQAGICALRLFQFTMRAKYEILGVRVGIEYAQQGL